MCEMVSRFWFVCHFSVAGLSCESLARREKCSAVDKSGHGHSRSQEAHFPNHFQCFDAKTVTSTLVSAPAISEFHWIQRGVDLQLQQSHVAVDTSSRNFGISTVASALNHDSDGEEFSVVLSSHQQPLLPLQREAARSAVAVRRQQIVSRACRSANCVSKAVIDYLAQQKVPETLVPEIVRPSLEAAELLSVSALVAAAATRVRVDPSGDVVMTPVDQAQQGEDNLPKIVSQLHVNLGHPSNDALARAIRLSGGSDDAIQAPFKVRCTVCERLTEPSPVPAASLRRWTEFGQCVALDLFMFADITGQKRSVFEHVGHGQSLPGCISGRRQESLDSFLRVSPWLVSHAWCSLGGEFESSFSELAEQIGCRLLPAAAVSPTQNAPCERAGGAWKYRARRLVDQLSVKWNDSSTKMWLCAVLNWSMNTLIGDSGHSPSQWVLGRSFRLPFSSYLVRHS